MSEIGVGAQDKLSLPETAKAEELAAAGTLQAEAAAGMRPRTRIVGDRAELLDSKLPVPNGTRIGPTDPNAEMTVTIMVKSKASEQEINNTLQKMIEGKEQALSDAEFTKRFGADPRALARVLKFAKDNGLSTEKVDDRSGQVILKGKADQFSNAFQVQLEDFQENGEVNTTRTGTISVPRNIAGDVDGVFGLDHKKLAESHLRMLPPGIQPRVSNGSMPNEIADAYKFPKDSMGAGQSVGILQFGGGLDKNDNSQFYAQHGLKEPKIQIVGIGGAKNKPGPSRESNEVHLDSQVIGAVAPDANQQIIFAPNTEQGFVDAVTRAAFPEAGEMQNSAISISWGAPESSWSPQALQNLNMAFKKAALRGISIFAAAGDDGAKDRSPDNRFTADYPASDPFVTGAGGTRLDIKDDKEITWNDGSSPFAGATGGGISEFFPVPEFQKNISMPPNANNTNKPGRGVPDVAGNASPFTGYIIRVNGTDTIMGGTSAVAPLYAALTMRLNGALGRPVGYLNPYLYKNGTSGIFRDITDGNNNGYNAGPGWDAATGWGSIKGDKLLEKLRKDAKNGQDNQDKK